MTKKTRLKLYSAASAVAGAAQVSLPSLQASLDLATYGWAAFGINVASAGVMAIAAIELGSSARSTPPGAL